MATAVAPAPPRRRGRRGRALTYLGALPFFLYVGIFLLLPVVVLSVEAFRATDPVTFTETWSIDSVVSVTKSHHKLGPIENGRFLPAYRPGMRSQDMADQYFENGVIYISRADMVIDAEDLFGGAIAPLVIEPLYALGDIDTLLDFQVAEFLFTKYKERFVPRTALPAQGAA